MSIVLGLVVTRYLNGIGRMFLDFRWKRIDFFYSGWVLALSLWQAQFCWVVPRMAETIPWGFFWFGYVLMLTAIFYLSSVVLFPPKLDKNVSDAAFGKNPAFGKTEFLSRHIQKIYLLMFLYQVLILCATNWGGLSNLFDSKPVAWASTLRHTFTVLLFFGIFFPKNRLLKRVILVTALATIVTFIGLRADEYDTQIKKESAPIEVR